MVRSFEEFIAGYQELVGIRNLRRELVQLGIPSRNRVVIWYACSLDSVPGKPSVELNGTIITDFIHDALPKDLATGRIEIHNLPAGSTCSVRIQLTAGGQWHQLDARTAPSPNDTSPFSFLAYSCFSPFEQGLVRQRTVNALTLAVDRGTAEDRPAFSLATGDQVYVDAGAKPTQLFGGAPLDLLGGATSSRRLYADGDASRFFGALYRACFSIPTYDRMLQLIPTCMMWDDHDIRDGWGSHGDEDKAEWREHYTAARRWFIAFQGLRNAAMDAARAGQDPSFDGTASPTNKKVSQMPEFCHTFPWGSLATVFVMDLRSQRSIGASSGGKYLNARVISNDQLKSVESWLQTPEWKGEPKVFVLVTSMPLTHKKGDSWVEWGPWFRKDDRLDNWWSEAAVKTRDSLVEVIVRHFREHRNHRLLVISGDVHFSEILELELEDDGAQRIFGHEVVSSGLAQAHFYATTGDRATSQERVQIGRDGACLTAKGLGRLVAPSFAELFVTKSEDPGSPPDVSVRFAAVAAKEKGRLIGTDSTGHTLPKPTMLPLKHKRFIGKFPFPEEPATGSDWDAIAAPF